MRARRARFGLSLYPYWLMSNPFPLLLRLKDAGRRPAVRAGLRRAYVHQS